MFYCRTLQNKTKNNHYVKQKKGGNGCERCERGIF